MARRESYRFMRAPTARYPGLITQKVIAFSDRRLLIELPALALSQWLRIVECLAPARHRGDPNKKLELQHVYREIDVSCVPYVAIELIAISDVTKPHRIDDAARPRTKLLQASVIIEVRITRARPSSAH